MYLEVAIKTIRVIFLFLFLSLLTACASKMYMTKSDIPASYSPIERPVVVCTLNERSFDCDRRAILAMLGEYQVAFNFYETTVLRSGYERKNPKHSGGFEVVVLVGDSGSHISMQHILVAANGMTIKHWRQDWVYELPSHWVYVGNQRFEYNYRNPSSVPGTWTQLVYEVNDGPRYAGSGRWNHRYGVSTWTSERTWRPLPRREYTKRTDYQLLNVENRHTITPQGWTHEQDNTKIVREDGEDIILVREFGFNDYRRITGFNFSPGLTYWKDTAPFWSVVRKRWDSELKKGGNIVLSFKTGDENFSDIVLSLADTYRANPSLEAHLPSLEAAFDKFVDFHAPARH